MAQDAPVKLALVIANSAYEDSNWPTLKNPVNDARLLNGALTKAGFRVMTPAVNLRREQLLLAVEAFRSEVAKLPDNSIALVYYSGHGLQIDGTNYLVPVGAPSPLAFESLSGTARETALSRDYVSLNTLLNLFGAARRTQKNVANLLILDACRVNPLDGRTRSAGKSKGLADIPNVANNLIAFAAAPGTVAYDGDSANSPYATALAAELGQKALPLELLFNRVTTRTLELTDGLQRPDYRVGLSGFFCLERCTDGASLALAPPRATAPAGRPSAPKANACPFCPDVLPVQVGNTTLAFAKAPVTLAQWRACVEELGCPELGKTDDSGNLPVTQVSWAAANQYIEWLSRRTGQSWRLPTSDEWAAAFEPVRDTTRTSGRRLMPVPAGQAGASGIGYFGQVLEWTASCGDASEPCAVRVARGATFDDDFSDLLSRQVFPADGVGKALGFRIVHDEQ